MTMEEEISDGNDGINTSTSTSDEHDPSKLTESELSWAKNIKMSMTEENETLAKTITDLEYAQLAIITKGQLERSMKMAHRLSEFKSEHGIDTNFASADDESNGSSVFAEKGVESITTFLEKTSPGFFMSFGRECGDAVGPALITLNLTSFLPRKYRTPEDWKVLFSALYYLFEASSTDIAAIREGTAFICDCDLIGWDNFSTEIEKYGSKLYRDSYPIRVKEMTMVRTPLFYRALYYVYKPFLSRHVTEVLNTGSTLEQIHEHYSPKNLPKTFEGFLGIWDVKKRLSSALKQRYESKATFTL